MAWHSIFNWGLPVNWGSSGNDEEKWEDAVEFEEIVNEIARLRISNDSEDGEEVFVDAPVAVTTPRISKQLERKEAKRHLHDDGRKLERKEAAEEGIGDIARSLGIAEAAKDALTPLTIDPKDIENILEAFATHKKGFSSLSELLDKYPEQIIDIEFLNQQIQLISDERHRAKAMRNLFKFQLIALGHEFSIGGAIELKGEKNVAIEGWRQANTHLKLLRSVTKFFEDDKSIDDKDKETIKNAIEHTAFFREHQLDYAQILQQWHTGKPVILPTGWCGHAVVVVLYKDYLVYANRGESFDKGFESGIYFYKIGNKENVNENFLKMLHDCGTEKEKNARAEYFEGKKEGGMHVKLGLSLLFFMKKEDQKVGNCSWASAKCAFQALLVFLELEKLYQARRDGFPALVPKGLESFKRSQEKYFEGVSKISAKPNSVEELIKWNADYKQFLKEELVNENLAQWIDNLVPTDQSFSKKIELFPQTHSKDIERGIREKIRAKYTEEKIVEEAQEAANETYKIWDVKHRAVEWQCFCNFLLKNNKDNKYLSPEEEFKIFSQMLAKFFSIKDSSAHVRRARSFKSAKTTMKELAREMISDKYTVQDAIISIPKATVVLNVEEDIIKKILVDKVNGAFMIYESEREEVLLTFKKTRDTVITEKLRKVDAGYCVVSGEPPAEHTFVTVRGVMTYLQEQHKIDAYPVHDEKFIMRQVTGNKEKD